MFGKPVATADRPFPLLVVVRFLIVALCAAIFAAYAWQTWTAWQNQTAEAQRNAANLAESFSQQAESVFETADSAIVGLQFRGEREGFGPANVPALRALMKIRMDSLPQLRGLFAVDAHGKRLLGTYPTQGDLSFRERDYYRYHMTHASRGPYIGAPIRRKVDGAWVVTVSRRVDNPDGTFRGIVASAVSLDYFASLYSRFHFQPNALIVLVRDDGTIVMRRPFVDRFIGANVRGGALFARMKSASGGTFTAHASTDRVNRITAFVRLSGFPLITAVGLPVDDVYADWRRSAIVGGIGALVLILIMLLLGRFLLSEIRSRESAQRQLEGFAFLDGLTELANRRRFDDVLGREWNRALRDQSPLALLMVDADNFKAYNDRYGHQSGDEVLKLIANCIRTNIDRPGDLGARYGGEEFTALLPSTPVSGATAIAERIRQALLDLRIPHADNAAGIVTISIGLASIVPGEGAEATDLIRAADSALYAAKRDGRNVVRAGVAASWTGRGVHRVRQAE